MAVFNEEIKKVLKKIEGGYSNKNTDRGGETFLGISKREYPTLDIKGLTEEQAYAIYQRDFWDRYRVGEIKSQTVAQQYFLAVINMNPLNAGRIIQRAANACVLRQPLLLDGVIGSVSLGVINTLDESELVARIKVELCAYYLRQVDLDLTQVANFRGWIRRALL